MPAPKQLVEPTNVFYVYTTGLGYYKNDDNVKSLLHNVSTTLKNFGYTVIFNHYDESEVVKFDRTDNVFKRYLTIEDIRQLETIPNHLLLDCAHITWYKPGPSYRYLVEERKTGIDIQMYGEKVQLDFKINALYPGFLDEYTDTNFISDFQFFTIEDDKVVTYITKGFEKKLKFSMMHKGSVTSILDFAPDKSVYHYPYFIHNTGSLSSIYSGQFATELFWSGPTPTMD
jgi:hypothetical protein